MKTLEEKNVLKILIVAGLTFRTFEIVGSLEDNSYALTDEEYKFSLGKDYIFFEITEPEQLAYTYKATSSTPSWWGATSPWCSAVSAASSARWCPPSPAADAATSSSSPWRTTP